MIRLELNREEWSNAPVATATPAPPAFSRNGGAAASSAKTRIHRSISIIRRLRSRAGPFTRKGFFAQGPPGTVRFRARSIPTSRPLSGPKADRLALINATEVQSEPGFRSLSRRDQRVLERRSTPILRDRTPLEAIDHLGVVNRLWPMTDQETSHDRPRLDGRQTGFIADGHHRYETGLTLSRRFRRPSGELTGLDDPANFVLMMLVGMSDPGLLILPTHRLVSGLPSLTTDILIDRLSAEFDCERFPAGPEHARAVWDAIEAEDEQNVLGFCTAPTATGFMLNSLRRHDGCTGSRAFRDWR